ncbi:MobF family relaxase [Nocardioides dongkuii]|uniref:MobF family relaxase n=1 Tax=Nocardioides dongkuii TaxID=2760089 RepID=UPI001877F3A7|nr:MobF family relaxase [Nocardioides dongkuii]
MSLHKLTAGDGYTYLTRQVAVQDATDRGASGLADYYAEKGESPGRWWGSGLEALGLSRGSLVTEAQMKSLYGEGRHPDARKRRVELIRTGASPTDAETATRLGQPFRVRSGETEFAQRVAAAFAEHNRGLGVRWSAPIDASTRSVIRTRIADDMFFERYGRRPADDRERHGFVAQASRQRTTSVAGFDLTFTPVKSVSTLWALVDKATARKIEQAHAAAVQDTLTWLESNVLFTRRGHNGVRQVATRGLLATVFTHRDSRAGDPNLHTHVAVSNKVQDAEGHWLAVDARVLFKANVTLSEHYNTRLEAELESRLNLRFASVEVARDGARPVREVIGVDARLATAWSRRRRAIDSRRTELTRQFQHDHGRPPTPTEIIALNQQANLETREAKHSPRSEQEQRSAWRDEAAQVLGSSRAVSALVSRALTPSSARRRATTASPEWVAMTAARVVATLEASRATWQTWHLRAEAERQARYADVPLPQLKTAVEAVVRRALAIESVPLGDPDPIHRAGLTPEALRRPDGTSAYAVQGERRFTSQRILDAEAAILDAAGRCDGRSVSTERLRGLTIQQPAGAEDVRLSDEQLALVARLAGAASRVQVALAPAGAGKTTCMQALAKVWTDDGGQVLGLAPSAAAAHQLRDSLSPEKKSSPDCRIVCETLAKLAWALQHPDGEPGWMSTIDETTIVIVDEAAMAGTLELATVIDHVVARGGTVRLVGDDRQLASVAAGGIVRDIVDRYGSASLTEPRRFTDPVEGAATLALRDGDPIALGYYADRDRLHVGDAVCCADQAYAAWQADLAAGRSSILMAPSRGLVRELNTRAQRDRWASMPSPQDGLSIDLADGTTARVGDVIITRRNDRRITTTDTDWVKNGDRWTLTHLSADGSVGLRHVDRNHHVTVPADYAAEHVALGYATTIHGAQGMTVDTGHAVLTGEEDRSLVYVALTRGRHANHAYVTVTPGFDSGGTTAHDLVTRPETLAPPTAVEILARALAQEAQSESATSATLTASGDGSFAAQSDLLRAAADRYRDSLHLAAERRLGPNDVDRLAAAAGRAVPGLTEEPAWRALRADLLLTAVDLCRDPSDLLAELIRSHPLDGARDTAAVLATRLEQVSKSGQSAEPPLSWLPAVPAALADDPVWRRYLDERREWIAMLAARLTQTADTWHNDIRAVEVPAWARPLLSTQDQDLLGDLALWRAVEGIDPADLVPAGTTARPGIAGSHQSSLERRATSAVGGSEGTGSTVLPRAVRDDPWLPQLHAKLQVLGRSGVDVEHTLVAALDDDRPLPSEVPAAALWWRAQDSLILSAPTEEPSETDLATCLGPDPRWSVKSATDYDRIVELHQHALAYYAAMYPRSWAPAYLTSRFYEGWEDDIADVAFGYAPPGPWSLGRHLLAAGASEQGLLDAGLAKRREYDDGTVRLVDTFRDRAVFALRDPSHPDNVVGFVGRRNPAKDKDEYGGPKYLNTKTTAAYAKSDNLFGLDLLTRHPAAGTAVVEGPLDALAVTLATRGETVGVAPLGTALTERQAALLARHPGQARRSPVLLFDGDPAGIAAADRAVDVLATAHLRARVGHLPHRSDPCQLLHEDRGLAIEAAIDGAASTSAGLADRRMPSVHETDQVRLREHLSATSEPLDRRGNFAR